MNQISKSERVRAILFSAIAILVAAVPVVFGLFFPDIASAVFPPELPDMGIFGGFLMVILFFVVGFLCCCGSLASAAAGAVFSIRSCRASTAGGKVAFGILAGVDLAASVPLIAVVVRLAVTFLF